MSASNRERLTQALTLAAPLGFALLVRSIAGGPSVAPAAQPRPGDESPTVPAPAPMPATPLSQQQQRVIAWLRSMDAKPSRLSPMDVSAWAQAEPPPPGPEPVVERTAPAAAAIPDEIAGLRVSAVLGRSDGAWVAFGAGVYKVEDEFATGWHIAAIDVGTQTARVRNLDGRVFIVTRESVSIDR